MNVLKIQKVYPETLKVIFLSLKVFISCNDLLQFNNSLFLPATTAAFINGNLKNYSYFEFLFYVVLLHKQRYFIKFKTDFINQVNNLCYKLYEIPCKFDTDKC